MSPWQHFASPTERKVLGLSCSAKPPGFLGTELYRDGNRGDRFLTIDRWRSEQHWRSFQAAFGSAYEALDARLDGFAVAERSLFEGTSEL
jgi:heme-degrading monooxygenase HmoA